MPIITPIEERVMNRIRPELLKMIRELGVKESAIKDDELTFKYLDNQVSIKVKSKVSK